jgi:hypothetical protein
MKWAEEATCAVTLIASDTRCQWVTLAGGGGQARNIGMEPRLALHRIMPLPKRRDRQDCSAWRVLSAGIWDREAADVHCNFAYSASACVRTGISRSAFFQSARKS